MNINTKESFDSDILVYDLSGRIILIINPKNENQVEINLESFYQGVYIVSFILNKKRVKRKFILSH